MSLWVMLMGASLYVKRAEQPAGHFVNVCIIDKNLYVVRQSCKRVHIKDAVCVCNIGKLHYC
uniref:Uncharacterized protein n=1 Tax=Magnetococcus massalia (strain MO-1) TaxID=451514 RepID=A0A1S7LIN4_MAGMO|nr:protein of unknown function [Candidatus Magnetococcus massalia]